MAEERSFERLVAIMDRLRDPGGCPWDREQTYTTLRGYLIEECYEVVDALDRADRPALREELGDLLFQIVFLAKLASEEGAFTAAEVVDGIAAKMVRRHPHVFGDAQVSTADEVLVRWEEIKRSEKAEEGGSAGSSVLSGIPDALPALVKAQRLGTKAARVGFDWRSDADVLEKLEEEIGELKAAAAGGDPSAVAEEIGDALFTLVMLARRSGVDADRALSMANAKFRSRFHRVEEELRRRRISVESAGLDLMDAIWSEVKSRGPADAG
jgi:MazG family protein